jgi:polyferredoxin
MHRRLEKFLPLVAIAVLVQVVAPIGGIFAIAAAVSDPVRMAAICSEMPSRSADPVPATAPVDGRNCCAFCPFGAFASAAIDPPSFVLAHWQSSYRRVIWHPAIGMLTVSPGYSHAQARAPPGVVSI